VVIKSFPGEEFEEDVWSEKQGKSSAAHGWATLDLSQLRSGTVSPNAEERASGGIITRHCDRAAETGIRERRSICTIKRKGKYAVIEESRMGE